jgi:hypothetical protein
VAKFLDSDELNSWPVELSLERLADVVHVEVEVRSSAAAQPQRAAITLDRALREWPWVAHAPMVKMKIGQLRMLRLGVAREVMPLVSEYQSALEYYIRRGNDLTAKAAKGRSIAALSSLTRNTAALLRDLDSKRLRFKPAAEREVVRTSDDSGGGKPAASPRD